MRRELHNCGNKIPYCDVKLVLGLAVFFSGVSSVCLVGLLKVD